MREVINDYCLGTFHNHNANNIPKGDKMSDKKPLDLLGALALFIFIPSFIIMQLQFKGAKESWDQVSDHCTTIDIYKNQQESLNNLTLLTAEKFTDHTHIGMYGKPRTSQINGQL